MNCTLFIIFISQITKINIMLYIASAFTMQCRIWFGFELKILFMYLTKISFYIFESICQIQITSQICFIFCFLSLIFSVCLIISCLLSHIFSHGFREFFIVLCKSFFIVRTQFFISCINFFFRLWLYITLFTTILRG